jgi:hypothetical protein
MMTEAIRSPEMSALTTATRRHIPEDGILQIHRRENLKSYILYSNTMLKVMLNYRLDFFLDFS